ncbi:MAG TPA: Mrp/NBP35 family ATP-binding protein [Chloroflexia bacterium]|nr:Mrp/NBP35 family ATP-binding protein [Chloroflexia bacterium]
MAKVVTGVRRVVAVASGKGGVGKTTVTVNLALALALDGARVGIFDADIYGPNVPLMLGVRRTQPPRGMLPVARADAVPYIPPLHRYGLQMMSIGLLLPETATVMPDPRFAGMIVTRTLQDVLWDNLDYLLIDLPPGTGEPQQSLVQQVRVDGAVVVTTPQDLSLLDAGRSLGLFRQAGVPVLGVVENMSHLHCPHCGEEITVFHHTDRSWAIEDKALPVLGKIPMDGLISRGIDAGHPLVQTAPDAAEASVFRGIARAVVARLEEQAHG